tara:strand:+ start:8961 stop:9392 length:432 start_codon:yes stop_codon:yes gene_type:complete
MFSRFFKKQINRVSFEDMQFIIQNANDFILINTLPMTEQQYLLPNTLPYEKEELTINQLLSNYETSTKHIIIYGKNTNDESVEQKYNQIVSLGFTYVFMYSGGMFEWVLLQDVYGTAEFPTNNYTRDILKFKPSRSLTSRLLL